MSQRQPITSADFEERTRSRLLLFLSVDLENSTRLKQLSISRLRQEWLGTVVSFIEEFPQMLEAESKRIGREIHIAAAGAPRLWKILGDELLFAVEVQRHSDVNQHMQGFRDAIATWNRRIRESSDKGSLLVKGTAWVAGFPVANAILKTGDTSEDYIGPSMDAGFRIAKLAAPHKLAVSVELGWMILECNSPLKLHFEGRKEIKGVAETSGYPELWLEVEPSNFQTLEDDLLGYGEQHKPDKMKKLCAAFIDEFGVPSHLPFLPGDARLGVMPKEFENELVAVKQFLRDEVYLVSDELEPSSTSAEQSKEVTDLLSVLEQQTSPENPTP
ncbi:MAG: hypothetical protein JWL90_2470 [Chthoniobacteraceae bacterium]|nr:hypothetical protein [Chthoniobacteraceae bacterium]